MKKVIISAALTGAATRSDQTPYLPVTPEQIATDVVNAAKAGAAIVHLHARDKDGLNTMDTDIFTEIYERSTALCKQENVDVIFNLTGSGVRFPTELRLAHLKKLRPEMCSFDPGTMNWGNSHVFLNTPEFLEQLSQVVKDNDIRPEIEIFDSGMIGNAQIYIDKFGLRTPAHYQFVLGVPGGMPASPQNLILLRGMIPEGSTWSVTGIGRHNRTMALTALALGCDGFRVGLEDNIYMTKGKLASNADFVRWAVQLAQAADRPVATASEAREMLGITRHWKDDLL